MTARLRRWPTNRLAVPSGTCAWQVQSAAHHGEPAPVLCERPGFIHNGDISDANGRNIVTNRSYPVNHSVFLSTGGRSDSAIFFAVILEYIGFGSRSTRPWPRPCANCAKPTRESSYNCMIQSEDQLIALCAAGREKTSPRIVKSTMSTAVASRPPTTV